MAGERKRSGAPSSKPVRLGANDGPVALWSPDTPLPVFAELDGRKVALVDTGEYRALLALQETVAGVVAQLSGSAPPPHLAQRTKARQARSTGKRRTMRLSRLQKDAEVADFIAERLGSDDVNAIRQAAIERFGAARVPSVSAVNRFVVAWRGQDGRGGR